MVFPKNNPPPSPLSDPVNGAPKHLFPKAAPSPLPAPARNEPSELKKQFPNSRLYGPPAKGKILAVNVETRPTPARGEIKILLFNQFSLEGNILKFEWDLKQNSNEFRSAHGKYH